MTRPRPLSLLAGAGAAVLVVAVLHPVGATPDGLGVADERATMDPRDPAYDAKPVADAGRADPRGTVVDRTPAPDASTATPGASGPALPDTGGAAGGIPVTNEAVVRNCVACHPMDDADRMSRISYMRKTPEGWQASLQRMMALQGVELEPETAREMVRYLANEHGVAPEELRPALWEVERRSIDHEYPHEVTRQTCTACHSMGSTMTQRRTAEEWRLLAETHRGYYPLVDNQAFRRGGTTGSDGGEPRYRVDEAVAHLADSFPLETAEWSEWSAAAPSPRLQGSWSLAGHEPGHGPVFGRVEVEAVEGADDEFTTRATYVYPRDGRTVTREGDAILYTGYQWRGRSREVDETNGGVAAEGGASATPRGGASAGAASPAPTGAATPAPTGATGPLREVLFVERGAREIHGRWFTGAHEEFGVDVRLHRIGADPVVAGAYPGALRADGEERELRLYGANLPADLDPTDVRLGSGVEVTAVEAAHPDSVRLRVRVAEDARPGHRDVDAGGATLPRGVVVYDRVHILRVEPQAGMARTGGVAVPRQYQQFEAIGYHPGPDGEPGTDDDLRIGPVPVTWELEEYPVTYEDDDAEFVGTLDPSGLFTPAEDGPNPDRVNDASNMGDVWVRATYEPADGEGPALEARGYLLVTAPVYIRWVPWDDLLEMREERVP